MDKEKLKQQGYELHSELGSGTLGTAFDIGNNKVLKVTTDESEANASNIIKDHPHKNIVKIFRVFKFKAESSYYIEQEKLENINETRVKKWLDRQRCLDTDKEFITFYEMLISISFQEFFSQRFSISLEYVQKMQKQLTYAKTYYSYSNDQKFKRLKVTTDELKFMNDMITAANYLKSMNIKFRDYHEGNIMQKSGTYKIIDLGISISPGKVTDILEQLKLKSLLRK